MHERQSFHYKSMRHSEIHLEWRILAYDEKSVTYSISWRRNFSFKRQTLNRRHRLQLK